MDKTNNNNFTLPLDNPPGILPPGQTFESLIGHSVVNLSSHRLTKTEVEVLEKGLTFCPTPRAPDIVDIWNHLEEFFRRLRIKRHFDEAPDLEDEDQHIFRNKSDWKPPEGTDPLLEAYIKTVKTELLLTQDKMRKYSNLSKKHFLAIKDLSENPHIVIKKVDKGSAICIMDTTDYIREATRQLFNPESYQKLDSDPTTKFSADIRACLQSMLDNGLIDDHCFDYLNVQKPTPGRFYLLPKIHKKGIPGRPICSSNNHPTERISKFVDHHIRKYAQQLPSHIRDTQHFITKMIQMGPIPPGSILVTWDVTSLYTNIPNREGINATMDQIRHNPQAKIPANKIGKLLEMVLHMNHFEFNKELLLQVVGTAMGSICAPSYANIFMGKLEQEIIDGFHLKPLGWFRFIDDIFFIWPHGSDSLENFLNYANNLHHSIKFTSESSSTQLNFLDTMVKIDPETRNLFTTLYTKPTDTRDFLHYTSSHPKSCKNGGPYGQFLRLRRICTKDIDFNKESQSLIMAYLRRGYPLQILEDHYYKASKFQQSDLLDPKTKEKEDKSVLILDYNPDNPNLGSIVRKYWPILRTSKTLGKLFSSDPLCAFKRPNNLKDLLISAKVEYPPPPPTDDPDKVKYVLKHTTCPTIVCKYCRILKKGAKVYSSFLERSLKVRTGCRLSCHTTNVIYIITCLKCSFQYVGETKRELRRRMYEHIRSIDKFGQPGIQATPVSEHFNISCQRPAKYNFQILENIRADPSLDQTTNLRRKRESWWILTLRTIDPFGMNIHV